MAYTFDPLSGATRDQLVELVLANSFGPGRYTEQVRTWLNDAVTDVCRKLQIHRGYQILDYGTDGVVVQPTAPFFHVDELWLARAGSAGTGEQAFIRNAHSRLSPLRDVAPAIQTGGTPLYYSAYRVAPTVGRYPTLRLVVTPAQAAGKVAIHGLQRPAVMDTGGAATGLGADLDDAVVAFVKSRCFRNEDDFEMSDRWRIEYQQALRDAVQLEPDSDGPDTVPGSWEF